ncbi:hypothetical protein GCM10022404_25670 [Celeribacter arenosi]|uniref:Uncharacterized protein n=1 Tax=Celeribacter arenosi TaxID=792649 RepID=A0ABP7KG90_9RHOB
MGAVRPFYNGQIVEFAKHKNADNGGKQNAQSRNGPMGADCKTNRRDLPAGTMGRGRSWNTHTGKSHPF